ncbi:MAG: HslU--HslV peptidase proteolytic subunit, partial [Acidobacteriota bacterium]
MKPEIHSTTILSVRRGPSVIVAGDGQVTLGQTVVKGG